jgi:hypothetical protein
MAIPLAFTALIKQAGQSGTSVAHDPQKQGTCMTWATIVVA